VRTATQRTLAPRTAACPGPPIQASVRSPAELERLDVAPTRATPGCTASRPVRAADRATTRTGKHGPALNVHAAWALTDTRSMTAPRQPRSDREAAGNMPDLEGPSRTSQLDRIANVTNGRGGTPTRLASRSPSARACSTKRSGSEMGAGRSPSTPRASVSSEARLTACVRSHGDRMTGGA
jgi:hypothetical protein